MDEATNRRLVEVFDQISTEFKNFDSKGHPARMKKMVNDISKYQQEQMKYKRIRKKVDITIKRSSIASNSDGESLTESKSCNFCNTNPSPAA